MPSPGIHIVKAFDRDLARLKDRILEMGAAARSQLERTQKALAARDRTMAKDIVDADPSIDALQRDIDLQTVSLLARRQPMALDLRIVVSSLKIAGDLERIADYSANVARQIYALGTLPSPDPVLSIHGMLDVAHGMLTDALGAFDTLDSEMAMHVCRRDDEIDHTYKKLLTQLRTVMAGDKNAIAAGTSLLFAARCCERIGDHIVNIGKAVRFVVSGKPAEDDETDG